MTMHCMRSYTLLVIKTCHKRGVHAMGGMAAHIPIRDDPAANQVRLLLHQRRFRAHRERNAELNVMFLLHLSPRHQHAAWH